MSSFFKWTTSYGNIIYVLQYNCSNFSYCRYVRFLTNAERMPGKDKDSVLRFLDDLVPQPVALPQQDFIGPRLSSQALQDPEDVSSFDTDVESI